MTLFADVTFSTEGVVIIGALFFLSTLPKAQPTHQIEVPVTQGTAH